MNRVSKLLIGIVSLVALVMSANWLSVERPLATALSQDYRNSGINLKARHQFYVVPGTLVLDLRSASQASPADLGRSLFKAAETFKDRTFSRIVLARQRQAIFLMEGDDFRDLGLQFAGGQNPVYLIRKLPSKLYKPDGEAAFGSWSGGLLSVVGKEIEDYNEAMRLWASGM